MSYGYDPVQHVLRLFVVTIIFYVTFVVFLEVMA
jgi:hypothetical protein